MGISVPIGPEHYKNLKGISDRLGFGLKKTVEYLVIYYCQKEMSKNTIIETGKEKPPKEITMEERYREIIAESFDHDTNKPTVAPRIPPPIISSNSTLKNRPVMSVESKVAITAPKTTSQYCSSCGAPKRINAKFCYNCGNLIKFPFS